MFPFNPDKTIWSYDSAKIAHRLIRNQVTSDLRARDTRRGLPETGRVYEEGDAESEKGPFVINRDWSEKKHTGAETSTLLRARWAEFCSSPQNERDCVEKYETAIRKDRVARMIEAGKAVDLEDGPPKRSPGRPRGSRNKSPEPLTPEPEPVAVTETTEAASAEG